jgi:hypothetical protein
VGGAGGRVVRPALALAGLALAACGPKVRHEPLPDLEEVAEPALSPEPPRPDAGVPWSPPAIPAAEPPDACGGLGWAPCYERAIELIAGTDAPTGMLLLRASCEEGDRRRCFERDRGADCTPDRHAAACYELARLYQEGRSTCPPDLDCAAALVEMACAGGLASACP